MMEDQLPDRVRRAAEDREFRQLLDRSSIGPIRSNRAMVQCGPCADDRCADIGCTGVDCSCICLQEIEVLTGQIGDALTAHDLSPDDATEIAESMYRKGWRRE